MSLDAGPGNSVALGPLLIVGMSRSGTQLLRELLNRHPRIGIPKKETHFIPRLVERFAARYREPEQRQAFRIIQGSDFYQDLRLGGDAPDEDGLRELLRASDIQSAIERVIRRCARPDEKRPPWIWGDKTPNNMLYLPLLAAAFPRARMLHIIRDPRDRAASTRRVWGADPLLSAQLWVDKVKRARRDGGTLDDRYREILYEHLVGDVERSMRALCDWLQVEFDSRVTLLDQPPDKWAAPQDAPSGISTARIRQHVHELRVDEVRRIEEIVAPLAVELGYLSPEVAPPQRGVLPRERLLRSGLDLGRRVRFFVLRYGVVGAARHMLRRLFVYRIDHG